MKVGSLVQAGSHTNWRGIVLQVKDSTRTGLHCNPELRYECRVRWFNTGYSELDGESWWGARPDLWNWWDRPANCSRARAALTLKPRRPNPV